MSPGKLVSLSPNLTRLALKLLDLTSSVPVSRTLATSSGSSRNLGYLSVNLISLGVQFEDRLHN